MIYKKYHKYYYNKTFREDISFLIGAISIIFIYFIWKRYLSLDNLLRFLYLILFIVFDVWLIYIYYIVLNKKKIKKYSYVSINNEYEVIQRLREFHPKYFEEFIELLFQLNDYKIIKWPTYKWNEAQKDWWIDLIIKKKDWLKSYVQIKKDFAHKTWVKVIREFNGTKIEPNWDKVFISSSIFSSDAIKEKSNIRLCDYKCLLDWINQLALNHKDKLEEFVNNKKHIDICFRTKPRTCKKCRAPMYKKKWYTSFCCMNRFDKNGKVNCDYIEK